MRIILRCVRGGPSNPLVYKGYTPKMDEAVVRSLARWPNVPAAFGWLALDARGNWLLRDPLDETRFERIANVQLRDFIARNYAADARGRWYFQNGPQRVFVKLHLTPLVLRLNDGWTDHCDRPVRDITGAWLDDRGAVILECEYGVGVVDDRDLERFSNLLIGPAEEVIFECRSAGKPDDCVVGMLRCNAGTDFERQLPLYRVESAALADRFGYILDPQPDY